MNHELEERVSTDLFDVVFHQSKLYSGRQKTSNIFKFYFRAYFVKKISLDYNLVSFLEQFTLFQMVSSVF